MYSLTKYYIFGRDDRDHRANKTTKKGLLLAARGRRHEREEEAIRTKALGPFIYII